MKFGIFGGSFDPVHYAHLNMAKIVLEEFNLDKIIFVPAYTPPHKIKLVASGMDRYNMLSIAIKNFSQYEIETYEINSKKVIYSYKMLDYLQKKYKNSVIKMIIGADSFNQLHTWKRINYIVEKYGFIVIPRQNINIDVNSKYYKSCWFSKFIVEDISSTIVRQTLKEKKDILKYVPKEVYEYIKIKGLYND